MKILFIILLLFVALTVRAGNFRVIDSASYIGKNPDLVIKNEAFKILEKSGDFIQTETICNDKIQLIDYFSESGRITSVTWTISGANEKPSYLANLMKKTIQTLDMNEWECCSRSINIDGVELYGHSNANKQFAQYRTTYKNRRDNRGIDLILDIKIDNAEPSKKDSVLMIYITDTARCPDITK